MSAMYDVVIVGGGVAGGLMACRLAQAGKRVVIVEAGAPVSRLDAVEQWAAAPVQTLGSPYTDPSANNIADFVDDPKGFESVGPNSFKSNYVRRSGGTTWHWQGSAPRFIPSDFELYRRFGQGVDWPIGYDELEPWYVQAEHELGVAGDHDVWNGFFGAWRSAPFPMPPIWPTWSDLRMAEAVQGMELDGRKVRVRTVSQARNSQPYQDRPACAGNSSCIPICPIQAKYDATVHLKRAVALGAQLFERTVAKRVRFADKRIQGIIALQWDPGGKREEIEIDSPVVVVAAHSFESVRLLWASEIEDPSGQLGCNLMDHPTGQVVGLSPWPNYPFRGPPVTSGIDEWRDGGFRAQSAAWKLSLGNDGHGRFRSQEQSLLRWMKDAGFGKPLLSRVAEQGTRMFRISWAAEQLPDRESRMLRSSTLDDAGLPRFKLNYRLGEYSTRAFSLIRTNILRIMEAAGISHIELSPDPVAYGGSGHIMGTCRMGIDPRTSVVDALGRAHVYEGLYVVGSSTFPTVGTANPTLTLAALALRTAAVLGGANDVR